MDSHIALLFLIVAALNLYFVPSIFAFKGEHQNAVAIFALNLLLGWTFVGWVVAFVWALTKPSVKYAQTQ